MLRKLTGKSKSKKSGIGGVLGAAVPYPDSPDNRTPASARVTPATGGPRDVNQNSLGGGEQSVTSRYHGVEAAEQLAAAAVEANISAVRHMIKHLRVDINAQDKDGNTALHKACAAGRARTIHYLLLHGANLEFKNKSGHDALYIAMDHNRASTIGVLLDYLHSVDSKPREPFILLRSKCSSSDSYIPERVASCKGLKPYQKRGVDRVQILVVHSQRAEDMSIFLYSTLDVSVENAFFVNMVGEMNMNNFQRFESKGKSQSLTILNSVLRVMNVTGYQQLRCLILVSCHLSKIILDSLPNLELLDVSYNKLDTIPKEIVKCTKLKTLKLAHNAVKRLPSQLSDLQDCLQVLDCSYNMLKRLPPKIIFCVKLKSLECNHNGILDLPSNIGILKDLENICVQNNKLSVLPLSIASLPHLESIAFRSNPLQNIPTDFPERVSDVQLYLGALQNDPVKNNTLKLVLVGQEGVGKSTLLRALKRSFSLIPKPIDMSKTDGIDIRDIKLDDVTLRCFDCGGDVDFNETHTFFITQGALYLVCFNLAEYCLSTVERSSFLLGRLQMWLQYIFSKVPSAQVIIVGTHADHPALTKDIFQDIWEQMRRLLLKSRDHHQQYFRSEDRLSDCLLCQSDSKCLRRTSGQDQCGFVNMGFEDTISMNSDSPSYSPSQSVVAFPHIVGYYEVNSVTVVGKLQLLDVKNNPSIQHLKEAVREIAKRLQQDNPEIPRKWADVQDSLIEYVKLNPDCRITSFNEVAKVAEGHSVTDVNELANMLHFLKAQGSLLYFPELDQLRDTIILDPQWLANIFSAVISFKDTGFTNEGFIHHETLKILWKNKSLDDVTGEKIIILLRHFGVCVPMADKRELFPCKLPIGEPDEEIWEACPKTGHRQLTYKMTFASSIPPSLFSTLLVSLHHVRTSAGEKPTFYANKIVDWLALERSNCSDCGKRDIHQPAKIHQVLLEIIPYARSMQITVRGGSPCCMLPNIQAILDQVLSQFDGLGSMQLDTLICPGCVLQTSKDPQKYSIQELRSTQNTKEKVICRNAHIISDVHSFLCGKFSDNCLPLMTISPKTARDKFDFSGCPKLFIMLPINEQGVSFDSNQKLFTSSLMQDGYAAHFLCEFPDGYHVTNSPGYRLKDPSQFMQQYGVHILSILHVLRYMSGSTVSPQYAPQTTAVTNVLANIIGDYQNKFPFCKCNNANLKRMAAEELQQSILQRGGAIQRRDLRKLLNLADRPDKFGPLQRLKYGQSLLWLCREHYKQMRVIQIGPDSDTSIQAYRESNA